MTNYELLLLLSKLLVNNSTYLTIITCYRPPNNDYNIFINELTDIILEYLSNNCLVLQYLLATLTFTLTLINTPTQISLTFEINLIFINITAVHKHASQHIYTVIHLTSYLQPSTRY